MSSGNYHRPKRGAVISHDWPERGVVSVSQNVGGFIIGRWVMGRVQGVNLVFEGH